MLSRECSQPESLTIVFTGNPGGGKSTILNGFLDKILFKSGISLAGGLTKICQIEFAPDGTRCIDTPGLSDIKLRKQAAREIKTALQQGGKFKIFFVITLEDGRIRPDDKTTMKLVLDAIPHVKENGYSIIINKLSSSVIEAFSDTEQKNEFLALLFHDIYPTSWIYLNKLDMKLSGASNVQAKLEPELTCFIADAPTLVIVPNEVKDIRENAFEEMKEALMEQMEALRKDKDEMEKKQNELISKFEKWNVVNGVVNGAVSVFDKVMNYAFLMRMIRK